MYSVWGTLVIDPWNGIRRMIRRRCGSGHRVGVICPCSLSMFLFARLDKSIGSIGLYHTGDTFCRHRRFNVTLMKVRTLIIGMTSRPPVKGAISAVFVHL